MERGFTLREALRELGAVNVPEENHWIMLSWILQEMCVRNGIDLDQPLFVEE